MNKQKRNPLLVLTIILLVLINQSCTSSKSSSLIPTPQPFSDEMQAKIDRIDAELTRRLDIGSFSGSVLVMLEGNVLLNKGYGYANREDQTPNTPQTRFQLNHATMTFTGLAVMLLYQDGKLDLRDPMCKYLDRCPTDWEVYTIADLLLLNVPIPDYTIMGDFNKTKSKPTSLDDLIRSIELLPLDTLYFTPGNWLGESGYILLGKIIEKVSGDSYEKFLEDKIFKPTGMKNSGLIHGNGEKDRLAVRYNKLTGDEISDPVDMSNLYSAGGLYSTVEDIYLFLQALKSGKYLDQEHLDFMFLEGHDIPDWWNENFNGWTCGWLLFPYSSLLRRSSNMVGADYTGSYYSWFPEDDFFIIFLINQEGSPYGWGDSVFVDPLILGK